MRAFAQSLLLVVAAEMLLGSAAAAQPGIYLPQAPTGPGGEDTIETSTGTRCRQSINSSSGYVDVGVAGSATSGLPNPVGAFINITERDNQAMAYARVTIPLGKTPKRIDCSKVYELEIAKLKQELELLRMNAE